MAIDASHFVPMAFVCFEVLANKIKIPGHHLVFNVGMTGLYILVVYVSQILAGDHAMYPRNLNFNCEQDYIYFSRPLDDAPNTVYFFNPQPGTCPPPTDLDKQ